MAKGKRSKGRNYVSKGERPNISKEIRKGMDRMRFTPAGEFVEKVKAWKKGKRVMLTIPNPNQAQTNKRFIRVEAREVWGSPDPKKD